jgi:hypothetical protein
MPAMSHWAWSFWVLAALATLPAAVVANYELLHQKFTADPAPLVYNGRVYVRV